MPRVVSVDKECSANTSENVHQYVQHQGIKVQNMLGGRGFNIKHVNRDSVQCTQHIFQQSIQITYVIPLSTFSPVKRMFRYLVLKDQTNAQIENWNFTRRPNGRFSACRIGLQNIMPFAKLVWPLPQRLRSRVKLPRCHFLFRSKSQKLYHVKVYYLLLIIKKSPNFFWFLTCFVKTREPTKTVTIVTRAGLPYREPDNGKMTTGH